jgi:PST family polysaccharide transporter
MIKFGVPVMLGGLMNVGTQLFVLSLVIADMGIEAGGHFQASWAISITYVGFILAAMGTDYLPRLTAVIHSHEKAAQLVNEQGEMALLLGGAVILAMITMAPLVIYVLYSSEFEPAGEVLRWQMLGSVMKLIGWPMGFVVLAAGRGGLIIYTQFVWNAVFILCLYFLLEELGLLAIGVSFCVAYIVGSLNVWFVANKLIGIVPTRLNLALTFSILVGGSLIIFLADISPVWSLWIGLLITAAVAIVSVKRLDFLIDVSGWLKSKFG